MTASFWVFTAFTLEDFISDGEVEGGSWRLEYSNNKHFYPTDFRCHRNTSVMQGEENIAFPPHKGISKSVHRKCSLDTSFAFFRDDVCLCNALGVFLFSPEWYTGETVVTGV